MDLFCKRIPKEIINIILEYDGRITYRNGVYIDKINKNDIRYRILESKALYKIEFDLLPDFYYASVPLNYRYNIAIEYDTKLAEYILWFVKHYNSQMLSYRSSYIIK